MSRHSGFLRSWRRGDRAPFTAKRVLLVALLLVTVPALVGGLLAALGLERLWPLGAGLAAAFVVAVAYLPARHQNTYPPA